MAAQAVRKSVKAATNDFQERRRQEALKKQQAARRSTADKARQLVMQLLEGPEAAAPQASMDWADVPHDSEMGEEPADSAEAGQAHRGKRSPRPSLRELYAQQLMQPEWMIDIPPDLRAAWCVMPRPEGQRCLVVAAGGRTTARRRNGSLLETFESALPSGSSRTGGGVVSVLDCVFTEDTGTFYVMDLLCWKGHPLYECTAEFRFFWLHTRLDEEGVTSAALGPHCLHAFIPLPSFPCTPEGLTQAYSGVLPFQRDGFLLLQQEGHYDAGEVSPLALLWKDAACSRYVLDTTAAGVVPQYQQVVLEYRMDRTVATADDPPVVLGTMPPAFVERLEGKLKAGRLLRFSIREGGIRLQAGCPVATDLHFQGVGNQYRGRADIWTKILFQYKVRNDPLTIAQIMAAASEEDEDIHMAVQTPLPATADGADERRGDTCIAASHQGLVRDEDMVTS